MILNTLKYKIDGVLALKSKPLYAIIFECDSSGLGSAFSSRDLTQFADWQSIAVTAVGGENIYNNYYEGASDDVLYYTKTGTSTSFRAGLQFNNPDDGKTFTIENYSFTSGGTSLVYTGALLYFVHNTINDTWQMFPVFSGMSVLKPYTFNYTNLCYNKIIDYPTHTLFGTVEMAIGQNDISGPTLSNGEEITALANWIYGNHEPIDESDPIPSQPDDDRPSPSGSYPDNSTDEQHATPVSLNGTMYSIYNVSVSNLIDLSSFLWSKDFFDNITKTNSNAIENIISLHLLPVAANVISASPHIIVGNTDSGVTAVSKIDDYIPIDYGTCKIEPPSGSFMDYSPYVKCQIHVPYCGFHQLNVDEIQNCTLNLKQVINVVTGAVASFLYVTTAANNKKMLYTYSGSCSIEYPITGANYTQIYLGIINTIAQTAVGVGVTMATGGAAGGAVAAKAADRATGALVAGGVGAVTDVMGAKPQAQRSGGFTGGTGYFDVPQAYIQIEEPKISKPSKWYDYQGKPSNKTQALSSCKGYTIVDNINLSVSGANDTELKEINTLLTSGVII